MTSELASAAPTPATASPELARVVRSPNSCGCCAAPSVECGVFVNNTNAARKIEPNMTDVTRAFNMCRNLSPDPTCRSECAQEVRREMEVCTETGGYTSESSLTNRKYH